MQFPEQPFVALLPSVLVYCSSGALQDAPAVLLRCSRAVLHAVLLQRLLMSHSFCAALHALPKAACYAALRTLLSRSD